MGFLERLNRKRDKIYYLYDFGRKKGQRPSTGLFTYTSPKNQIEKNHNKETLAILSVKKGQQILDSQAVGTGYIPHHRLKQNFLDFYSEYVKINVRKSNRALQSCFNKFKIFCKVDFLSPMTVNYDLCHRFRRYLLDTLTGETPLDYYATFKKMLASATRDGYFKINPTEKIAAVRKPSKELKEILEIEDYLILVKAPFPPDIREIIDAFLFSCYTGLRWCDVKPLVWADIKDGVLTTRIIQAKTGQPVLITLHPIAKLILEKQRQLHPHSNGKVFVLPSADGCNKTLKRWVCNAGIKKKITWSCARLSVSVLLQDLRVDNATIAYILGHTTTKQVEKIYKRHRPKNQEGTVRLLPTPEELPEHLCQLAPPESGN